MKKISQIWIETVIYTLIGLAIIGILLSLVKPAIEEKKDEILIKKSLEMLETINGKIEDVVYYGVGNSRILDINIAKGKLKLNSQEENLEFSMESSYMYSELDTSVSVGKINATTTKKGNKYDVKLLLNYNNLNLTWNDKDETKIFQASPSPYKIAITNKGATESLVQVDFS